MKMKISNYIIIFLIVFVCKCISQPLPIVSLFSRIETTAHVTVDLNQEIMTAEKTLVPSSTVFDSILYSTSDYYKVLFTKTTNDYLGYGIGNYYLANNSIIDTKLFEELNIDFFAYDSPIVYYDDVANLISVCGFNAEELLTITTYDVETGDLYLFNTTYLNDRYNIPVGVVGPQPSQISFFFVDGNTTDTSLLILDTNIKNNTNQQGTLYIFDNYNEIISNFSVAYPVSVKGQLYLIAVESKSIIEEFQTYNLLQVTLDSTTLTASVKELYKSNELFTAAIPGLLTQDQQNFIFISRESKNSTKVNFTVYNIQSTQSQTITLENTLDFSLEEYNVYFAQ